MHTLTDFTTHIKGVEYLISVLAITGFILFVEILKPKPFRTLKNSINEDREHIRKEGTQSVLTSLKRLAAAPFIGLAYVVSLPFVFTYAVARECIGRTAEALEGALGVAGFGWRPMEAYLGGKKDKKNKAKEEEKKDEPAAKDAK
ncbi:MAG: hypothetical protein HY896_01240 [Deltaproteobacteria bacterium]|nr:hypothetical protein [Deltaproteobacteria bacterium]